MTQYFSRTSKTLVVREGAPGYEVVESFQSPQEPTRVAVYSPDGSRFAYATASGTFVVDPETNKIVAEIPIAAADLYFSPQGSFLVTWTRPQKDPESGNWHPNLKVWQVAQPASPVAQYLQKGQASYRGGWSLQYTADEKYALHQSGPNTLEVLEGGLGSKLADLSIPDGIAEFAVSPGQNPAVAVFVIGQKGRPSSVRVYGVPSLSHPVAQRTIFKAEAAKLMWNKLGTTLLVLATTDVDQSGKSYYGESTLFLLSTSSGADQRIMLGKEGPIHDVSWSPSSDEFGVVYGYMPSKTTFLDSRGNEISSLPVASRNTISYSPHGRFILVAGFGNLQGTMEIYDRNQKFKKVTTIQAPNTSHCDWSPDGRYILTATTSPRLRVDNGVKLWHYSGKFMYAHDDDELLTVNWRPQDIPLDLSDTAPVAHSSVDSKPAPVAEKPKAAYRPPHARGVGPDVARTSLYQRSMVNDSQPDLSKAAAKNKKKREGKKDSPGPANGKDKDSDASKPGNGSGDAPGVTPGEPAFGSVATPEEKQIRSLLKKLRAIEELKERQIGGDTLEANQIQKIESEKDLIKKLQALGWSS